MRTIYKYPVEYGVTYLPLQGRVLSAGVQDERVVVWAVHDDAIEAREFEQWVSGADDLDPHISRWYIQREIDRRTRRSVLRTVDG